MAGGGWVSLCPPFWHDQSLWEKKPFPWRPYPSSHSSCLFKGTDWAELYLPKIHLPPAVLIGGVDLCVLLLVKNNHSSGHYSCCTSSFNWCNARRNESEGGPQKPASEWEPTRTELLSRAKKVHSWQLTRSCRGVFLSAISQDNLTLKMYLDFSYVIWVKVYY